MVITILQAFFAVTLDGVPLLEGNRFEGRPCGDYRWARTVQIMTKVKNSEMVQGAEKLDPLLTPAQVARVLECSERRVMTMMRKGQMPGIRTGARQWRCSTSQLRRFINLGGTPGYVRAELAALDEARGVGPRPRR